MFGSFSINTSRMGHTSRLAPYIRHLVLGFNLAALALLTGCAKDTEEDVRTTLSSWVALAETVYFSSKGDCTAGLFKTQRTGFSEAVVHVRGVRGGLQALKTGATVAFDVSRLSPNEVSQQITSANLAEGIAVISSGAGGRRCMSDDIADRFYGALTAPSSVMIFDTAANALAVLRPELGLLFFARGDV